MAGGHFGCRLLIPPIPHRRLTDHRSTSPIRRDHKTAGRDPAAGSQSIMHPTLDAKTHLNYPMSPDIGISGYPDTAPV